MDVTNTLRNRHDVFLASLFHAAIATRPCGLSASKKDDDMGFRPMGLSAYPTPLFNPLSARFPLRSVHSWKFHTLGRAQFNFLHQMNALLHGVTSSLQALGSIVPRTARSCFLCLHPFTRSNLIRLESGRHPIIYPDKGSATITISRYVA